MVIALSIPACLGLFSVVDELNIDLDYYTVLEPCVGGGHMADGIQSYCGKKEHYNTKFVGTDIRDRGY